MATIASNVKWGSSPPIYFDFSYEKKRDGSTQYYKITVSCDPLTGTAYFGYPIYVQIYLDGKTKVTQTLKAASPNRWTSAISYTTGWLSVSKTSGTTALAIRIYSGSGSTRNTTYNYTLAIDQNVSTISCTTANIESNPTITIAKASSNFTHTITYTFGSLSGTIAEKTSATSIKDWTIPEEFYAQIPNAKTGTGTLTCDTYNGNTKVGTTTCKLSVTTDETKCKPTFYGKVVDYNPTTKALTGDKNVLVKGCSIALCSVEVTLNKSAGSVSAVTINNMSVSGNTMIRDVDVGVFDFWVKDSRGYTNTDKVVKDLIPYIPLTATVTAWRDDPTSGNATIQIEGNCFKGNFGVEDNELTVSYRYGDGEYETATATISDENKYTIAIPLSGVDYTRAYDYEVVVSDKVSSVTKTATIQKGIPVFDWGEEDFNFNVPISLPEGPLLDYIIEAKQGNDYYYRKWASGITEAWLTDTLPALELTSQGGVYTHDSYQNVNVGFPSSIFSSKPFHATINVDGVGCLCGAVGTMSRSNLYYHAWATYRTILSRDTNVYLYVVGRWK